MIVNQAGMAHSLSTTYGVSVYFVQNYAKFQTCIYIHLEQKCKLYRILYRWISLGTMVSGCDNFDFAFLEMDGSYAIRSKIGRHVVTLCSDVKDNQPGDHKNYPSGHQKRIDDQKY